MSRRIGHRSVAPAARATVNHAYPRHAESTSRQCDSIVSGNTKRQQFHGLDITKARFIEVRGVRARAGCETFPTTTTKNGQASRDGSINTGDEP
ncbi:MAG: hypothetical protein HY056_12505 [Proteobacteria bacterium]|nr:hypothetical protein [Pseudomonadota bacterium]